jgi:hypothetical protein
LVKTLICWQNDSVNFLVNTLIYWLNKSINFNLLMWIFIPKSPNNGCKLSMWNNAHPWVMLWLLYSKINIWHGKNLNSFRAIFSPYWFKFVFAWKKPINMWNNIAMKYHQKIILFIAISQEWLSVKLAAVCTYCFNTL